MPASAMASITSGLSGSSVLVDGRVFPATAEAAVRAAAAVGAAAAAVGAAVGAAVPIGVAVGATMGVAEGATVNGGIVGGMGTDAPPAHANVKNLSLINETKLIRARALP